MKKQKKRISFDYRDSELGIYYNKSKISRIADKEISPGVYIDWTSSTQKQKQKVLEKKKVSQSAVNKIVLKFISKLRLNSTYRRPPGVLVAQNRQRKIRENIITSGIEKISQQEGFQFGNLTVSIWYFINLLYLSWMMILYSITIAFKKQTQHIELFFYSKIIIMALNLLNIFLNFTTQKYQKTLYCRTIGQIAKEYGKIDFKLDIVCEIVFFIQFFYPKDLYFNFTIFAMLASIIKSLCYFKKVSKLEQTFINNSTKEHYLSLIKVLLVNFVLGHFLSICLNLITEIEPQHSWYHKIGIQNSQWFIKYVWGYYWGTNIMLTVGFGDISANNFYEAILLIFIQTFSCITLAYNINCVGALISSIRREQQDKNNKLKTFHRMCKQNTVKQKVQAKIANFIEQQYRIKQQFQQQKHNELLDSLPEKLQYQYRKQANQSVFKNLGSLNFLLSKSLQKLAQSINRKIYHPQEIVLQKKAIVDLLILQKGRVSFCWPQKLGLQEIQHINVGQEKSPKILSYNFIKNQFSSFVMKSNDYSFIYYMKRETFFQTLKEHDIEFEKLCQIRDKDSYEFDQIAKCDICVNDPHNKFQCSKLHFIPLRLVIVLKQIENSRNCKQKRSKKERSKYKLNPLQINGVLEIEQKRYLKKNRGEESFNNHIKLMEFYQKVLDQQEEEECFSSQQKSRKISQTYAKTVIKNRDHLLNRIEKLAAKESVQERQLQFDQAANYTNYFSNSNPQSIKKSGKSKIASALIKHYPRQKNL